MVTNVLLGCVEAILNIFKLQQLFTHMTNQQLWSFYSISRCCGRSEGVLLEMFKLDSTLYPRLRLYIELINWHLVELHRLLVVVVVDPTSTSCHRRRPYIDFLSSSSTLHRPLVIVVDPTSTSSLP